MMAATSDQTQTDRTAPGLLFIGPSVCCNMQLPLWHCLIGGEVGVNVEYLFIVNGVCVPADECSYWLPLYGSMCCRLAAQPRCMTQQMMSGCLKVKASWLWAWF